MNRPFNADTIVCASLVEGRAMVTHRAIGVIDRDIHRTTCGTIGKLVANTHVDVRILVIAMPTNAIPTHAGACGWFSPVTEKGANRIGHINIGTGRIAIVIKQAELTGASAPENEADRKAIGGHANSGIKLAR